MNEVQWAAAIVVYVLVMLFVVRVRWLMRRPDTIEFPGVTCRMCKRPSTHFQATTVDGKQTAFVYLCEYHASLSPNAVPLPEVND